MPAVTEKIEPPWTDEQVAALNRYQTAGKMHPFTCGGTHERHVLLMATSDGWICPAECGYEQKWAHAFMTNEELGRPWTLDE
jgi:hypothetical protein